MKESADRNIERKVYVQYRDSMNPYEPIENRKYTVTHSDTSGDLYLYVGNEYALDKVIELRDELIATWENYDSDLALIGKVLIDGEGIKGNPEIRNNIFINEIHKALETIRYGDRFFFERNPELDNARVLIYFISEDSRYDRFYDYGTVNQYRLFY